jgi:hypothetical protein
MWRWSATKGSFGATWWAKMATKVMAIRKAAAPAPTGEETANRFAGENNTWLKPSDLVSIACAITPGRNSVGWPPLLGTSSPSRYS